MGMDQVRTKLAHQLVQPPGDAAHQGKLTGQRQAAAGPVRRAIELPIVDNLALAGAGSLLGRGQMRGLPADQALHPQDVERAKDITALLGQRMVEDMQHAHLKSQPINGTVCRIGRSSP